MSGPRNPRSPLLLRYIERLSELAGYASAVLILASMLIVCYGVLLRYVFGASTVWQLELSTYFLMFAAFVGGAYGLEARRSCEPLPDRRSACRRSPGSMSGWSLRFWASCSSRP